jgi:hypothetical protein
MLTSLHDITHHFSLSSPLAHTQVQARGSKPEEVERAERLFEEVFSEASPEAREEIWAMLRAGAQFTACFTSTKAHILTQVLNLLACFTSTRYKY